MGTLKGQFDSGIGALESFRDTYHPFAPSSTRKIGAFSAPPGSILSIKVYCTEDIVLPVRLARIKKGKDRRIDSLGVSSDTYELYFADATGREFAYTTIYQNCKALEIEESLDRFGVVTGIIVGTNQILKGHITYSSAFVSFIAGAVLSAGGEQEISDDSFILASSCHVPWFNGVAQSVLFKRTPIYGRARILPSTLIITPPNESTDIVVNDPPEDPDDVVSSEGPIQFGIAGVYQHSDNAAVSPDNPAFYTKQRGNGFCKLIVTNGEDKKDGPFWIGGKHLVLRHTKLSNLRVVSEQGGSVALKGVTDV